MVPGLLTTVRAVMVMVVPGIVVIHIDVIVGPVEPCPGGETEPDVKTGTKTDIGSRDKAGGVVPVIGGIGGIPPGAVDIGRVIDRHIDDFRVSRLDLDELLLDDDALLLGGRETPLSLCFLAQFLDGGHDLLLLAQESVPQFPCLVKFIAQGNEYVRGMAEGFHAGVPRFFLQGLVQGIAFEVLLLPQPALSLNHFKGVRGGHQDLGREGIGI
jgi:hypothetical protein